MNLTTGTINKSCWLLAISCWLFAVGCNSVGSKGDDDDESSQTKVRGRIEVRVVSPATGSISQFETLNATTTYMLSDAVRAPVSGYIRKVDATPGQLVKEGDLLFTIQGKEAAAMDIIKDTSLHIKGTILVKATEQGIVKTIERQEGDYVQDGDELCSIANSSSLVFMLDVPFEMRRYVKEGETYTVTLPDGGSIQTHVTSMIAEMDKSVQMERYILKSSSALNLPAGLIATVKIPSMSEKNAVILPKSAILCDETQTSFWVMKILHDSLAVKIPIEKGLETKDSVQVKSPPFSPNDKILVSGNYGISDTTLVKVIK